MLHLTDQTGNDLSFSQLPLRIVSLVPSISETLAHCIAGGELVGITKFCIHPETLPKSATIIGGTKNPHVSAIQHLAPDLVIANKEENRREDVEAIRQFCPVYVSDIKNVNDVESWLADMTKIFPYSTFTDLQTEITQLFREKLNSTFRAAYLIWQHPYMTVGSDTFIHAMMEQFGLINIFGHEKRYPVIDLETIRMLKPDVVLLSSEPFPFRSRHAEEMQKLIPEASVLLADGELFSWFGIRMLQARQHIPVLVQNLTARNVP